VIITDKLTSYGATKQEMLPGVEHRQHRYLNNRAQKSYQPTRQRDRRLQGFTSPGHAQCFLAAYGPIAQHVRPRRHRLRVGRVRQRRDRHELALVGAGERGVDQGFGRSSPVPFR
jgi:putative transposase